MFLLQLIHPPLPGTGKKNRDNFVLLHNAKKGKTEVEKEKQKIVKEGKKIEKKLAELGVKYSVPEPVSFFFFFFFFNLFISSFIHSFSFYLLPSPPSDRQYPHPRTKN